MNKCSRCENPSTHSILVRKGDTPPPNGDKDRRGVYVVRFCAQHWAELENCLPDPTGTNQTTS